MLSRVSVLLLAAGLAAARRSAEQTGLITGPSAPTELPTHATVFLLDEGTKKELESLGEEAKNDKILDKLKQMFPTADTTDMEVTTIGRIEQKASPFGNYELTVNWKGGGIISADARRPKIFWTSLEKANGLVIEPSAPTQPSTHATVFLLNEETKKELENLGEEAKKDEILEKLKQMIPNADSVDIEVTAIGGIEKTFSPFGNYKLTVNWKAGGTIPADAFRHKIAWTPLEAANGLIIEPSAPTQPSTHATVFLLNEETKKELGNLGEDAKNDKILEKLKQMIPNADTTDIKVTTIGGIEKTFSPFGGYQLTVNWKAAGGTIPADAFRHKIVWSPQ